MSGSTSISQRRVILEDDRGVSLVCLDCGARSWHPEDIRAGWCERCGRTGTLADYADRLAAETFEDHAGLAGMAAPKIRHHMGLEARTFAPPSRWDRVRCGLLYHAFEIQTRAVLLKDLPAITWWGVPKGLYPVELLATHGVGPDRCGLIRVAFLECQRCGWIGHPRERKRRRAAEEALRGVPG